MIGLVVISFAFIRKRYSGPGSSILINYSVRNDLTGLAIAAFIAWKLTVNNAITIASNPASKKINKIIMALAFPIGRPLMLIVENPLLCRRFR